MVKIVYHADLEQAQGDEALRTLPPARGPFDRLAWLALLARECLHDTPPLLALASDDAGCVVLPLRETGRRRLDGLANWYSFWLRPLGEARLLTPLARDLARRCDAIALREVPQADAEALVRAFREAGWIAFSEPHDCNHFLKINGHPFADYWASRPGALRETVRRKGRKGTVALRIAQDFLEADWADYEQVYALSWKPGEGSPAFLRRFAEAEAAAGRLRLGIASIDGKPVAAQFWTVEAGTAFIHKLAHDERAKAHSPGTLLSATMFEHVIDRDRVEEIDFGTGDDPYKRGWMEQHRQRYAVSLFRPGAPRQWPAIVRGMAARLRR